MISNAQRKSQFLNDAEILKYLAGKIQVFKSRSFTNTFFINPSIKGDKLPYLK